MTPRDRERFPETNVTLKDGRGAVLRLLQRDDGERLGDMYEGLTPEASRFYWPHPLDRERAMANATRADSPVEVVLVLVMPAEMIGGYAWYRWRDEQTPASSFGICIASDCQSRGAGRILMEKLLEIAHDVGPPMMQLTCQHANSRAVALYLKMGFHIVREGMAGPRRGWPTEPQYWMERARR